MLKRHSGGDLFAALVRVVAENTSANNHTEARILIAEYFSAVDHNSDAFIHSGTFSDIAAKLRANLHQHQVAGYLTSALSVDRNALMYRMMELVKSIVTGDEFMLLNGSL